LNLVGADNRNLQSQGLESTTSKDVAIFSNIEDATEDMDAAVYRRAK